MDVREQSKNTLDVIAALAIVVVFGAVGPFT